MLSELKPGNRHLRRTFRGHFTAFHSGCPCSSNLRRETMLAPQRLAVPQQSGSLVSAARGKPGNRHQRRTFRGHFTAFHSGCPCSSNLRRETMLAPQRLAVPQQSGSLVSATRGKPGNRHQRRTFRGHFTAFHSGCLCSSNLRRETMLAPQGLAVPQQRGSLLGRS